MRQLLARRQPLEYQSALILWNREAEKFLWVKRDDVPSARKVLSDCAIAARNLTIDKELRVVDRVNHNECLFAVITNDEYLCLESEKVLMVEVSNDDVSGLFSQRGQVNLVRAMIVVASTLLSQTADQEE